jgi:hypothetical protein
MDKLSPELIASVINELEGWTPEQTLELHLRLIGSPDFMNQVDNGARFGRETLAHSNRFTTEQEQSNSG